MGSQVSKGPTASASAIDAPRDSCQASQLGISLGIAAGLAIFTAAALVATLRHQSWDFALIKAMNSVAGHSLPLDRVARVLTVSQLLQGVALVAMLWHLWFANQQCRHKGAVAGRHRRRGVCGISKPGTPACSPHASASLAHRGSRLRDAHRSRV